MGPDLMGPDLIPADVRGRLRALRLTARRAADLQGLGLHHSRSRGAGLEFAQYRAYERGDAPRMIDWKLYGRSGKFFVREAERESPLRLWILVDGSASMAQADRERPDRTRMDAARGLAACLGQMAMNQGDRFGMVVLSDAGLRVVDAGGGARQRDRMALALVDLAAAGGFPSLDVLGPLWDRVGPSDLVVLISDFFDEGAVGLAERLAAARREVLAIQILSVEERDFPFAEGHRFRDPETAEELLGDGRALRDEYLRAFGAAQAELRARLEHDGVRYARLMLDEALDVPLRRLFGGVNADEYH
jgi:uncharacterized protein (DUF58 family)